MKKCLCFLMILFAVGSVFVTFVMPVNALQNDGETEVIANIETVPTETVSAETQNSDSQSNLDNSNIRTGFSIATVTVIVIAFVLLVSILIMKYFVNLKSDKSE